jgi:hypothetical protein
MGAFTIEGIVAGVFVSCDHTFMHHALAGIRHWPTELHSLP